MAFNVVAELSKTPEIFEEVLLHLTQCELLHAQRVNRYWLDLIAQSPSLQQKLFFQPIPTAEATRRKPELNPLVEELFPFLFTPRRFPDCQHFWGRHEIKESIEHWADDSQHRNAVLRLGASWRRMLPVQPAARLDGVISSSWGCTGLRGLSWCEIDASKYVQAPGTTGQMSHRTFPDLDLGTCATMGLLYDIVLYQLDDFPKRSIYVQWQMLPEAIIPRFTYRDRPVYKDQACTELDFEATFGNSRCVPTRSENIKLRNKIIVHSSVSSGAGRRVSSRSPSPTGFKVLEVPNGLVREGKKAKPYCDGMSIAEYHVWGRLPGLDSNTIL